MTNQSPREFWLLNYPDEKFILDKSSFNNLEFKEDAIHVVEAGPVLEKIEALNESIRQYKISNACLRESNHISHGNNMKLVDALVKSQKERDTLKALVEIAVKALEALKKTGPFEEWPQITASDALTSINEIINKTKQSSLKD